MTGEAHWMDPLFMILGGLGVTPSGPWFNHHLMWSYDGYIGSD